MLDQRIVRVAAYGNTRRPGRSPSSRSAVAAVHARHDHVGQQQIDRLPVCRGNLERLSAFAALSTSYPTRRSMTSATLRTAWVLPP